MVFMNCRAIFNEIYRAYLRALIKPTEFAQLSESTARAATINKQQQQQQQHPLRN